MSDYTSTFTEGTGDTIDASDFSTEFDAIETAIATKQDSGAKTLLNRKVIEIGDWDMDATANVSIAHGLTLSKIRSVSVVIRQDSDGDRYPIDFYSAGYGVPGGQWQVNATNVVIARQTSGPWDTTLYNDTSYNRGWITIEYTD